MDTKIFVFLLYIEITKKKKKKKEHFQLSTTNLNPIVVGSNYYQLPISTILLWVPVRLTGKIFDNCIRDLRFNLCLHQKLIGVLT